MRFHDWWAGTRKLTNPDDWRAEGRIDDIFDTDRQIAIPDGPDAKKYSGGLSKELRMRSNVNECT